jgi:hypothetical protein
MLALMKPKNPVTISIIATVLAPPCRTETLGVAAQSKGFRAGFEMGIRLMIWSNTLGGDVAGLWLPSPAIKAGARRF